MALTTYVTDTHADTSYVDAVSTVVNHLSKSYGVNSDLVHTGDFVDFKSTDEDIKRMNESLGKFDGGVYGILGNHDLKHERIEEKLDKVELLEFKKKSINGLTHYGIRHHSGNVPEHGEENNYKSLEDRFSEVEENLPNVDVLLAHEGMDEFSYKGSTYHHPTSDLVKKYDLEVVSGHVHSSKSGLVSEDSLAFGYRGCALNDNDLFIRVGYGTQSQMYQISNTAIREWAAELNPKGDYKSSVKDSPNAKQKDTQITPEELNRKFNQILPNLNPEFLKKLQTGQLTREEMREFEDFLINSDDVLELAA